MNFYRVKDWDRLYENNRTRELKTMPWIPVPTRHDGDGYTELLDHKDGAAHLGAWLALLQVAGRCDKRGTLLRGGGTPHTIDSLSRITRVPARIFEEAIPRLVSIGWLETCTIPQEPAEKCDQAPQEGASSRAGATQHDIREQKIIKEKERAFRPPSPEDVEKYCRERNSRVNAHRFCDFYGSKGWMVGRTRMKDWQAAVRNWEAREQMQGDDPKIIAPSEAAQRIIAGVK